MKTRADLYGNEAKSLLRDITMYHVLTKEQILRLYSGKTEKIENLLSYLTKQGRIHCINSMYCDTPESVENLDRGLLAAVWVLTEFIDQAEYHTAGDYPAKVIFAAGGDVYEIVYVAEGKEILISNVLKNTGDAPPRYILLVDDPAQIEQLYVPNVGGYCTVTPEGNVQFYQKE